LDTDLYEPGSLARKGGVVHLSFASFVQKNFSERKKGVFGLLTEKKQKLPKSSKIE